MRYTSDPIARAGSLKSWLTIIQAKLFDYPDYYLGKEFIQTGI